MDSKVHVKSPKSMALVLMLGAFIGLFGETALNMALTEIMAQFEIGATTAQWLTTGYLLTLAILVPVSALLMKWFTTKQLVIGGLTISLLGALFAAMSLNFPMLMLGRVIQAVGTGILLPVMLSVVMLIFPIHKRGMVMGIMGLVITTAPALGPTLSGIIISTMSWEWIFWFSAVVYVLITLYAFTVISNVSEITKPKIDLASIALSTAGFGGLVFALSALAEQSITAPVVFIPLIIGIIALIAFGGRQLSMDQPMVDLRVFKRPMFTLGTLIMFLSILIILSTAILLPLYLKGALMFSAMAAGLLMLPGNFMNFILSPVVGGLFDKVGPRVFIITGFVLIVIANFSFLTVLAADTPAWQIVVSFMILFVGLTMTTMPAQTNAMNQLTRDVYADGSAAMNTLNQVAGAVGTAVAITVFTIGQNTFMAGNAAGAPPEMIAAGVKYAFYFITGISIFGLICALFVRSSIDPSPAKVEVVEEKVAEA